MCSRKRFCELVGPHPKSIYKVGKKDQDIKNKRVEDEGGDPNRLKIKKNILKLRSFVAIYDFSNKTKEKLC